MSCFLRKTIPYGHCNVRILPQTSNLLGYVGNPDVFSLRWFSSVSNQSSFAVSYLMRELGFSQKSALEVSKRFNIDTSKKPEKVIKLFKKYGFTLTQVCSIFRRKPQLLVADAEKTISPKLEFFDAKGVSWPQFAKKLSSFPAVLGRSLDNQILPSYEFLRNFLQSDEKAIKAVERYPDILIVKCFAYNIDILREHGVPDSNIAKLIPKQPQAFALGSDYLRKIVEKVEDMGFDASKVNFVLAMHAFQSMSKPRWESKVDVYRKWGWSEEVVLEAFKKSPWCMTLSEGKLTACMDFYINQMGWRPCLIAECPVILTLSLKKRIVPRCSVFQILLSKGLVEKEVSFTALLKASEEKFLQRFVAPYKEDAPELLKLYKEKLNLSNGPLV